MNYFNKPFKRLLFDLFRFFRMISMTKGSILMSVMRRTGFSFAVLAENNTDVEFFSFKL